MYNRIMTLVHNKKYLSTLLFVCWLVPVFIVFYLYLMNIIRWSELPDLGFAFRTATGIKTVGNLREGGRNAGLQSGDLILTVNGKDFKNISEFRQALNRETGQNNNYLIEREGKKFEVRITNQTLGFKRAFIRSGIPYLVGLTYFLIAILVFLMKPHHRSSWVFLLCSSVFGSYIAFLIKIDELSPFWLSYLHTFLYTFTPAVFIHMAMAFPEERMIIKGNPYIQLLPYLPSALLFAIIGSITPEMWNLPRIWRIIAVAYMVFGMLVFIGSCLQLRISSKSEIVKARANMILVGLAITASIPLGENLLNSIFGIFVVPSQNYYLPFLVIFPLSLGFSIVKFNLFDFDAVIKRTYGYILTTGAIAGFYALFVFLTNLAFGRFEFTESPLFPLIFILAVVFFFNPIRDRVQKFIDRVFYRLEYDYQETVEKISEALRSVLTLDEIKKRVLENSVGLMFVESGSVLLLNPKEPVYETVAESGAALQIPADESLIQKLSFRKREVTLYEVQEDPFYANVREACRKVFKQLQAALIIPMIYEERLLGLISLGQKKSGKFYRREDIKLLKVLANQGAVAVQNARLADQMRQEEVVRTNLSRYLSPQIVDQIIKQGVDVNLGGERKVVTVLFSDIRNFTRISESLTPDQLICLLNEYFTDMAKVIFENQGSLDKYIGDAIVAVFGSLVPVRNAAEMAVRAAVQMMEKMPGLNQRCNLQYGVDLNIGIGINTGEVLLGNIGSPERMEFTVIGDTVNIASRFSGLAKPGQILVTRPTLDSLPREILCQELPPTEVKGKTGKLEVFEVVYPRGPDSKRS
jgi:adenylate cyclase